VSSQTDSYLINAGGIAWKPKAGGRGKAGILA